jgi:hypothetical protein
MQDEARRLAALTLRDAYGVPILMTNWSNKAAQALSDQWGARQGAWDWPELFRRYREPKCFHMAMWSPDERLVGLALARLNAQAVTLMYVEGDPQSGCEYKGKRALAALEACANYAQAAGVGELRIHALNPTLANLYEDTYGFSLATPRGEEPYYAKRI